MENPYYKLYNKKYLLAGTIYLAIISMAILGSSAYASSGDSNKEGNSIVGNYADGYELGKENGRDDYRSGNSHDSKCSPNDSLSWCTGYKVGYEAGWFAARTLGGE